MQILKKAIYLIKFFFKYKGFKYQCPFCRKYYRQFYPGGNKGNCFSRHEVIGAGYRKNVFCPHCKSKDRERLVYLYLKNCMFSDFKKIKVLHIAPENSIRNYLKSMENIEYIAGDKFEPGYSYPKGTVKMDILNIDYPANYFDFIICNHVLEHIQDDNKALSEIYRVLKEGSKAILQIPYTNESETIEYQTYNNPEFNEKFYGQSDHVRLYSKRGFLEILEKNNFTSQIFRANKKWRKYCINENEFLFVVQK